MVEQTHLVDCLLEKKINIKAIFSPEHGFRGDADAGEHVKGGIDTKTGISIISLYGDNKKPTPEQLKDIDIVVFDIQDVGARFYTYISTMHYVMEACAEQNKSMIVLDRPNPNGHYTDGPVLEMKLQSFIGMHPIPIVHGLTVGELAGMINGEKWLDGGKTCDLTVVTCKNYDHNTFYSLPIPPSPNLPNMKSIYLYPSLCLLEGTTISCGRGTDFQFQLYGHPKWSDKGFSFTPMPNSGAKNPKYNGVKCYGVTFSNIRLDELQQHHFKISYLLNLYASSKGKFTFFNDNNMFSKLAGTDDLREQIINGMSEQNIRKSWEPRLSEYKQIRKKYLLYTDFE